MYVTICITTVFYFFTVYSLSRFKNDEKVREKIKPLKRKAIAVIPEKIEDAESSRKKRKETSLSEINSVHLLCTVCTVLSFI